MKFTRATLKEKQHEKLEFLLFCRNYVKTAPRPADSCASFWEQDHKALASQIEEVICDILQEALDAQGKKTLPKAEAQKAQPGRPAKIQK